MKRILSGITPTGDPHIGNYFGMLKPMIDSQSDDTLVHFFISDQHTFTTKQDPEVFKKNLNNCILDWLALGADPEKHILFRQSDVRAHTELAWYLSGVTHMGLLERAHAYKDKTAKGLDTTVGLFSYPMLMTADILLYDIETVPVGKDQKQHVEMARDIAGKFNHHYGETFVLPEPEIREDVMTIPGLDGAKMSKSYGNTIEIFADEKTLKKKVDSIKTDSTPLGKPIDPDKCLVMQLHKLFGNPNVPNLEEGYRSGEIGYGESKNQLFEVVWEYFREAREKRAKLEADPDHVQQILALGAQKANKQAEKVLNRARRRMGLGSHISLESAPEDSKPQKKEASVFSHSSAIWEKFPNLVAGAIRMDVDNLDIDVDRYTASGFGKALKKLEEMKESEFPAIAAWRKVYSEMGLKPTQYRCAAESLLRRLRKDGSMPSFHPIVDICNSVSASFGIPIFVVDLDEVDGAIEVDFSRGDEEYLEFSGEMETPEEGEVVFRDNSGHAHSRRWCYRQSKKSAVNDSSSRLLIVAEAHHDQAQDDIDFLMEELLGIFDENDLNVLESKVLSEKSREI